MKKAQINSRYTTTLIFIMEHFKNFHFQFNFVLKSIPRIPDWSPGSTVLGSPNCFPGSTLPAGFSSFHFDHHPSFPGYHSSFLGYCPSFCLCFLGFPICFHHFQSFCHHLDDPTVYEDMTQLRNYDNTIIIFDNAIFPQN